jgi:hypothetical protein
MNAITRRENFVSEVQAPIVAALRAGELTDAGGLRILR